MSFEAYSCNARGDDSPISSCGFEEEYDSVSPTQLLSLAIRKRREQYEEKDCDLKRQILHTGMIRSLCKYLGEGRAKRRRSRHRSSRHKASKRRWEDAAEKQGQNDDNLVKNPIDGVDIEKKSDDNPPPLPASKNLGGSGGGSDEDSGFESSSPTGSPPSSSTSSPDKFQVVPVDALDTAFPHETSRSASYEFTAPQPNGGDCVKNDGDSLCGDFGEGPAKRAKFSDERCAKLESIVDDFMDCDPFGLDSLCTPPPTFADSQGGLPVHYSADLCDSTWTFDGRIKKYSSRKMDESTSASDVSSWTMDYCVAPSSSRPL